MFEYRLSLGSNSPRSHEAAKDMCNAILGVPGDDQPCKSRYPWQRYFQVNLIPLLKYGTMEFRGHSATYDQERVARWIQFLIAFVDYYGKTKSNPPGAQEMNQYFSGSTWQDGFRKLANDQQTVTRHELWEKLRDKVDASSKDFFARRAWEEGDRICQRAATDTPPRVQEFEDQCCLDHDFNRDNRDNAQMRLPQTERFAQANDFIRELNRHQRPLIAEDFLRWVEGAEIYGRAER